MLHTVADVCLLGEMCPTPVDSTGKLGLWAMRQGETLITVGCGAEAKVCVQTALLISLVFLFVN